MPFDWKAIDLILQMGGNLIDCSELTSHSEDTIQRRIRYKFKCTFTEYRYKKMSRLRMKVREAQYNLAVIDKNPTMCIHMGKVMLDQNEAQKLEHSSPDGSMTPKASQVVLYLPDNGRDKEET